MIIEILIIFFTLFCLFTRNKNKSSFDEKSIESDTVHLEKEHLHYEQEFIYNILNVDNKMVNFRNQYNDILQGWNDFVNFIYCAKTCKVGTFYIIPTCAEISLSVKHFKHSIISSINNSKIDLIYFVDSLENLKYLPKTQTLFDEINDITVNYNNLLSIINAY
jgi:hypothetical protein